MSGQTLGHEWPILSRIVAIPAGEPLSAHSFFGTKWQALGLRPAALPSVGVFVTASRLQNPQQLGSPALLMMAVAKVVNLIGFASDTHKRVRRLRGRRKPCRT